jgi:hypothetical protein
MPFVREGLRWEKSWRRHGFTCEQLSTRMSASSGGSAASACLLSKCAGGLRAWHGVLQMLQVFLRQPLSSFFFGHFSAKTESPAVYDPLSGRDGLTVLERQGRMRPRRWQRDGSGSCQYSFGILCQEGDRGEQGTQHHAPYPCCHVHLSMPEPRQAIPPAHTHWARLLVTPVPWGPAPGCSFFIAK